jgi:hypothetical protein
MNYVMLGVLFHLSDPHHKRITGVLTSSRHSSSPLIILATWEAEIRTANPAQYGQKNIFEIPSQWNKVRDGMPLSSQREA